MEVDPETLYPSFKMNRQLGFFVSTGGSILKRKDMKVRRAQRLDLFFLSFSL